MKKLLVSLVLCFGFVVVSQAQVFTSRSFINARSVLITNVVSITNLTSSVSRGTNIAGTVYTNLQGVRIVSTNGTGDTVNLLATVPLFVDRNANMITSSLATNCNIFVRLGSSGVNATNSTTFVFAAVPSDSLKEATAAADLFTFSTTANTAYPQAFTVKVPYDKFVGDYALMLRSVSTTAVSGATGSDVWLLECSLNGFAP